MSTTSLRRRERSSSPESRENDPSPTRKRSSSPDNENENIRGDESGEKRCKCYSCGEQPYDVDRNWSIRFFGRSKEFHDNLMRLLDESLEDDTPGYSCMDSWEECSFTPTDSTEIVDAYPSEIEESPATSTESSDGSGINGVVIETRRDPGAVQNDGQTRNDAQEPHLVPNVDSSPPRND